MTAIDYELISLGFAFYLVFSWTSNVAFSFYRVFSS